jgi:hypothetical protein
MLFSGKGEQAVPHFAQFIRLSPRDPRLFLGYLGIGWARLLLGDDEGAIEMLRTAVSLSPSYSPAYLGLAAAYGLLDRLDEARSVSAAYLRTGTPTNTIALVRARETSTHRHSWRSTNGFLPGCAKPDCRKSEAVPPTYRIHWNPLPRTPPGRTERYREPRNIPAFGQNPDAC